MSSSNIYEIRLTGIGVWSLSLWGEGPQGHRIKPLITQHKQNKRHINKS